MSWRRGLTHPLGLALLLLSAVIGAAVAIQVPSLERGAWLVAWGSLAYGAVAVVVALRPNRPTVSARKPPAEPAADDFVHLTDEALKRLNSPRPLGECTLALRIPMTLAAARGDSAGDGRSEPTPLEQARALRSVLVSSIEQLKPDDSGAKVGEAAKLQYVILHEEYVLGRPNGQIMTRYSISESTFHRYRREGIRVLAGELERGEDLLRRGRRTQP